MIVSPPDTSQLAPRALQPQLLRTLTVGQLLDAIVIGRRSENSITLAIGGARLAAATTADPAPGTRLTLEVVKTGVPVVVRPLPGAEASAARAGAQAAAPSPAVAYLRIVLPRSAPQSEVLGTLQRLAPAAPRPPSTAPAAPPTATQAAPQPMPTAAPASGTTASDAAQQAAIQAAIQAPGVGAAAASAAALPPRVAAEVAALIRALPGVQDLGDAGRLARAVRDSGLALESRLASALPGDAGRELERADVARDYKWLLLRVYQALRSALPTPTNNARSPAAPEAGAATRAAATPEATLSTDTAKPRSGDLQRAVSAGLARIQTLQLGALHGESEARALLTVELPVRSGDNLDVVELTVEADDGAAQEQEATRAITVRVPVPGRGTAIARVAMTGDAVSVHLSADDPGLLDDMNNQLPVLEQRLQRAGLNTAHVAATPLPPDEPQRPPLALLNISI